MHVCVSVCMCLFKCLRLHLLLIQSCFIMYSIDSDSSDFSDSDYRLACNVVHVVFLLLDVAYL